MIAHSRIVTNISITDFYMLIIPIQDKIHAGRSYYRFKDLPFVFPRNASTPPVGVAVEVMFTGVHYQEIGKEFDLSRPKMVFMRPVTDKYLLVDHDGFTFNGNDNPIAHANIDGTLVALTPGRTGAFVGKGFGVPGQAYVRKQDLHRSVIRIEGVAALYDLESYSAFK